MEIKKIIAQHLLDHHYFGNGLYGMLNSDKLINNFTHEDILNYFFNGLDEVLPVKDKEDFEGLLGLYDNIPEDIKDFILKYILSLQYFYKNLSLKAFKIFIAKAYGEYKKLCSKYDVYC